MMLAMPVNRSAIAANHTTKVALAIGYAKIMLESIIINPPRPRWTSLEPLTNTPVTTCSIPNKSRIIAATVKVAATA
jgi:hypothetical protein